ncbi:PilT/PilU family type 4a pilus ATPase [Candidatus Falkowbacteria bacterium]|nr:PilT/PilU family type 4a pilus ATPase [Candidatus Falkowbacteria bacterium]
MDINQFFSTAITKGASDVHLVAGHKPTVRIFGKLQEIDASASALDNAELTKGIFGLLTKEQVGRFEREWELDFAYQVDHTRFRVNLHYQLEQIGLAARLVPKDIPTPAEINLEPVLYELTHLNQGFILVTGPTGSGKSTTIASMLNIINTERRSHIITLEDPIEFIYPKQQSIVEQREVGRDTKTFHAGLKYVLRQDPNVILIGEMRDPETIAAALTAAETGHLVFSTLHTNSAAETVERIIDSFDSERQRQILIQLGSALKAVVTQQLVPTVEDKVTVAREIMINTPAIANLIRQNKIAQIPSVIQTGRNDGMMTMSAALKNLYNNGLISADVYQHRLVSSEKVGSYF